MTAPEEWRPISGLPDYDVSSHGRVLSRRRWRGDPGPRVLRPGLGGVGYLTVALTAPDGSTRSYNIHHLVASAFIGARPAGMEIRHLDGDKLNNHPSNLAYGSSSENNYDQVRHGTHRWASATHCKYGHPWDKANTTARSDGGRGCRACTRRRSRDRRARLRAANVPTSAAA